MQLHQEIESWIEQTNAAFADRRQSCVAFENLFAGFYSREFLRNAFYVLVDEIPLPNFPELREIGLGDLLDMPIAAITYKNIYYLRSRDEPNSRLHFHELVHVAQWELLGVKPFIERYTREIQTHGYNHAPLENMARELEGRFARKGEAVEVFDFVRGRLS